MLFDYLNPPISKTKNIITISKQDVDELRQNYKRIYSHMPDNIVLKALIQSRYYDEILINEGKKFNIVEDNKIDTIKKMRQILTNRNPQVEPTEEILLSYYKKNIDDYSYKNSISFMHIFYKSINDEKSLNTQKILEETDINKNNILSFSDNFSGENVMNNIGYKELENIFGKYFSTKVFSLKKGLWHMPVRSKYGYHFIYVLDYKVDKKYDFNEIEHRVYEDYIYQQKKDSYQKEFKKIEINYTMELLHE